MTKDNLEEEYTKVLNKIKEYYPYLEKMGITDSMILEEIKEYEKEAGITIRVRVNGNRS